MSETNANPTGGDSAAAGAVTDGAAASGDAGAAVGGQLGAAAPAAEKSRKDESPAARAMAKATAKRDAAKKGGTSTNSSTATTADRAAGGGSSAAAASADGGADANGGTAAAGAEGGSQSPTGSTVAAPDDWSEEGKARFAALPNDEARGIVLDTYKDMARQFTQEMSSLAELRKGHEDLHRTLDAHGINAEEANRVLSISAEFNKQPRQVLQQLAAQAGIEVFFERPLAADEMPEFKNTKEMVEWLDKRSSEKLRTEREAADEASRKAADVDRQKQEIRTQLSTAHEKFGDSFVQKRAAVIERMLAPVSAEDAYSLLTIPDLRRQAEEGASAKQQLAALKAKVEADRKNATIPPKGVNGATAAADDAHLSPGVRAYRRASQKRAAAGTA